MIATRESAALTRINPTATATRALFERLNGGPLPLWERLESEIRLCRFEAGGSVFMQGAEHPFAYVARRGLVKLAYHRDDGEEWIKSFAHEGMFFASIAALQPGGATSFAAVCLEDCELERLPFARLEQLAEGELSWANALRRAVMIFAERKEKRERELLTLKPAERYRQFVAETPDLEKRIPQKDLARHLGVTPVGLNRIVRRFRST